MLSSGTINKSLSPTDSCVDITTSGEPRSTNTETDWSEDIHNAAQNICPVIMAVCTDATRCGCAVYSDSCVQLVADRRDPNDPYKGLDIIIQRINPEAVVVSSVQKRLISFLEKRFKFNILDLSRRDIRRSKNEQFQSNQIGPTVDSNQTSSSSDCQTQSIGAQLNNQPSHSLAAPIDPDTLCEQNMQVFEPEGDIFESAFTLVIVPNIWFSMSKGLQKLLDSEMVRDKGFQNLEEKLLFITSKVEKSVDVCAIRAVSALDAYLLQTTTRESNINQLTIEMSQPQNNCVVMKQKQYHSQMSRLSESRNNSMPILDVRYMDPGPVLSIDRFTLESLGIFHPTGMRSSVIDDTDIEIVPSLYEVLNQCQSVQGKKQLKTIMLWPLQDAEELGNRYDTVAYFMDPEHRLFRDQLIVQLKAIVPLAGLLAKLSSAIGSHREFSVIYKVMWSFLAIVDLIKSNCGHDIEVLNRIESFDYTELRLVVDSIMNIIDFEASRREKKVQVCVGVDVNVDEKREVVNNLSKFCDQVALQETAKYKDVLRAACRVIYVPRIGFLNSVDYTTTAELMQIRSNNNFDVLLNTDQAVYFKTKRMEELDNNAGDIACDLIDIQESIIVNLQTEILKHTEVALRLTELCGELDCLIAFSLVAFQRGYVRPEIVPTDEEIDIKEAYHPLHCIRYNIIPNDVRFYKESSERRAKVMVVTGPNSCGKTTFMKATCLVIYMAHIGSFVPAKHARITVVDAILSRMHSGNSISTGLSSFANDLHQVNYALGRATDRSIIVIDEFGKGTHAQDGFQLLRGLIKYFVQRIQDSPYVMISTHYSQLVNHLQNYSEYILYKTFKVTRDHDSDTIMYEYKLVDGVGESSLADNVAVKAGVPQSVIDRASQVRNCITAGRPIRSRPARAA